MPSSVRRLTTLDHERLHRLLRRTCSPGPSQQRWRAELVGLLQAHRRAEREVVLVELVNRPALEATARQQEQADAEIDMLAERLRRADLAAASLEDLRTDCDALLGRHARRWSDTVMAPLEGELARGELRRLGGAYEQRRDDELAGAGVAQATPRRLDLSRAELYEMARRAGIEGRSAMTRRQLIDQLQGHTG